MTMISDEAFIDIVRHAWIAYDKSRSIKSIVDISAQVSTNHVFKVTLPDREFVIAKLSYYGQYEHFREDHTIINSLSNNLPYPFENLLSRAFMKGDHIFIYRHNRGALKAWVIFYRPVKIKGKLPRRLSEEQIDRLGKSFARFHLACHKIRHTLPPSTKSMRHDISQLMSNIRLLSEKDKLPSHEVILRSSEEFLTAIHHPEVRVFDKIPVFVDWNIGNFSTTPSLRLFSRWDYDWFRMSTRMLDFYFMSRVVSDIGDRTYFHYFIDPLLEDRFILFLQSYHSVYPLTSVEILFLKEVYRFFILNYVIKDGKYFFKASYAARLQKEAVEEYLPSTEKFDASEILNALQL